MRTEFPIRVLRFSIHLSRCPAPAVNPCSQTEVLLGRIAGLHLDSWKASYSFPDLNRSWLLKPQQCEPPPPLKRERNPTEIEFLRISVHRQLQLKLLNQFGRNNFEFSGNTVPKLSSAITEPGLLSQIHLPKCCGRVTFQSPIFDSHSAI